MPGMRLSRRPRSVRISSFTGTYSVKLAKRPSDVGVGVAPDRDPSSCAEAHPPSASAPAPARPIPTTLRRPCSAMLAPFRSRSRLRPDLS